MNRLYHKDQYRHIRLYIHFQPELKSSGMILSTHNNLAVKFIKNINEHSYIQQNLFKHIAKNISVIVFFSIWNAFLNNKINRYSIYVLILYCSLFMPDLSSINLYLFFYFTFVIIEVEIKIEWCNVKKLRLMFSRICS